VAQCITKWGKVPFTGTFTNVRRIKAAVSVYGIGNVINDVNQTAQPMLVLIDAGVNVMGNPVYNLLNNNGYYCMKVNVNVKTDLDINLACNAKLADNSVQVNVASEVDSETSVIGVNVGSNVQVTRMTSNRGECAY
jgi:4-diphosphocytidyl-2C-methyl-D-erythritol kinase